MRSLLQMSQRGFGDTAFQEMCLQRSAGSFQTGRGNAGSTRWRSFQPYRRARSPMGRFMASGISRCSKPSKCAKSLSEKFSGPKGDPGAGEMQQREIVFHLLLPPDEQPPTAVHPGMRALHRPAPRPVAQDLARGLHFFAAVPHVSRVAPGLEGLAHGLIVVPFVQAQVLRLRRRGLGAFDHDRLQGGLDQFHVMAIGTGHGDAEGQAMAVRQQAPLGPELAASGRILADLFPPQAAPWSWPRPSLATPTPGLSGYRTSATPPARAARTPGLPAMLESGHAPYWERPGCAAAPSMGSQCATQTKWRSLPADPPSGAGHLSSGLWVVGARAPSAPTAHQGSDRRGLPHRRHRTSWFPPLRPWRDHVYRVQHFSDRL